jgi:DNA-binding FadR family transcriptional regulator
MVLADSESVMAPVDAQDPTESVESLTERIQALVGERQALRAAGANLAALECNRLEIARLQQLLSRALIQRYLSVAA